jgi:hypothetical protein
MSVIVFHPIFSDDAIEYESIFCWVLGLPAAAVKKPEVEVEKTTLIPKDKEPCNSSE